MSDYCQLCNTANGAHTHYCPANPANERSELASATGSVSAEQWWTHHAELLAAKMKCGGVKSFRIELTPRGTYEFEVVPTAKTPNADISDRR